MDKFDKVVNKNVFSLTRPKAFMINDIYYNMSVSFDKFREFMDVCKDNYSKIPRVSIKIYDEAILDVNNREELKLRLEFLCFLKKLNIRNIDFYLSDSSLPVYNEIMSIIEWEHFDKTNLFMKINRNPVPVSGVNHLKLEKAQGKLCMDETDLIWVSDYVLPKLRGKVDDRILDDTDKLKDEVLAFSEWLDKNYYTKYFNDFDKMLLVYDFITKHIKFADEAVETKNGKQVIKYSGGYNWFSKPLGTLEHRKGVCAGQARLAAILANNYELKTDTVVITGDVPAGAHAWTGTVIEDKLYHICYTRQKLFFDPKSSGYVFNEHEIYPRVYQSDSLDLRQVQKIKDHVRRLKKNYN